MIVVRTWIPAVVIVLMLAGCAPAAPEAAPTDTPVVSPTPSATAQGDPWSTLPLACADLLSEAEAQALTGAPVTLKEDESFVDNLRSMALRQVGALSCTWGGEELTDNSYNQTVDLTVLPDADAAFDEGVWQVDDGAIVYPEGSTTSEYLCQPLYDGIAYCTANVLLNGYWAQAWVQADNQTEESITSGMRSLVDTLTTRMGAAGAPRPAWVSPEGSLTGAYCGRPVDVGPPPVRAMAVGFVRSGALACTSPNGAEVIILPAGAWGVPIAQGTRAFYAVSEFAPFDVPGADFALWGCGDGCSALVSVGGSAVSIYAFYDLASTVEQLTPLVTTIVADVTAAG